ncbi:AAA family ATPase [Leptothrix sp. BB-4]
MTLQLTRIQVEQVRKFRQPFALTDLQPGLNLFSGDNEAGKSTLVRAIRAAFFERHGTSTVTDLRPWDDGSATPQVEIDFRLDGEDGRLTKAFLGRKRCLLQLGSRRLEGTEAEDLLAERLGYGYAAKGASKTEHWGIPGLLWIEQGAGQDIHDAAGHAREHLRGALQRGQGDASGGVDGNPAGALAASLGDALQARLLAARAELLTSTGRARGGLADAQARVDTLTAERDALDQRIATYRGQVDQLDALRRAHAVDAQTQPWQALEAELASARAKLAALQDGERLLAQDQQRLATLQSQVDLLQQQVQAGQQQAEALSRREAELAQAQADLQVAESAAQQARERLDAAQALARAAAADTGRWRARASRAERVRQQREQHEAQAVRQAALVQAEAAAATLTALRAQAAAVALAPEALKSLRALDTRLRELQTRHDAAATRLSLDLLPGVTLTLQTDGEADQPLTGSSRQVLVRPATLDIPGVGRLVISPGGQDLDELARQRADAQARWLAACQSAGVADLAAAEQRQAQQADLLRQIGLAEQALALHAPQGLDALRRAQAEADARLQQLDAALAALEAPQVDHDVVQDGDPDVDPATALTQAEARQQAADAAVQLAQQAAAQAGQRLATATTRHLQARHERDALAALRADPARQAQDTQASGQLLSVGAERAALALRIEQTRRQLDLAQPRIVEQDVQRLTASVAQLQRAHQQRHEQILVLETQLAEAGAQGLDEARAQVDGERARAVARRDELQRRADALDLLCRELGDRRAATLARLQVPLMRHLQHHLGLLFPQATLAVDAQLVPGELTRPDARGRPETGAITALSYGAREQLGLIARCAYADLLREAGRPTLLILDDALVHTDAQRLAQMKRVLYDAAQRHQVLLFTCHPEDWRDLGVMARPIQAG